MLTNGKVTTIMNSAGISGSDEDLEVARAVMRAVKGSLPAGEFEVCDESLFLSSESATPRAAFAVVLPGIQFGLVPVDFDVPKGVEALAYELTERIVEIRAQWRNNAPGTSSPISYASATGIQRAAAEDQEDLSRVSDDRGEDATVPYEGAVTGSPVTLGRSGVWLLTTLSGARLIVAVVVDPATKNPVVTVTRYAAMGNGNEINGAPFSVDVDDPPELGRRFCANVIATDARYPPHDAIVYGGASSAYVSTPITSIQELTFEMVVAASSSQNLGSEWSKRA